METISVEKAEVQGENESNDTAEDTKVQVKANESEALPTDGIAEDITDEIKVEENESPSLPTDGTAKDQAKESETVSPSVPTDGIAEDITDVKVEKNENESSLPTEDITDDVKVEKNENESSLPTDTDNTTEDTKNKGQGNDDKTPSLHEMKIIRQIEYYFGNVNLWRDKFLKEKRKEDDGWITVECLTTFNRLQALTVDFEEIINALKKSKSGLLEIDEENMKVRRSLSMPLPDPDDPRLRKLSKMKTLYIKGLPITYTLDDVQDFLLKQGCLPIFTKMRKNEEKNFKGSIIVELTSVEEANKLLNKEIRCEDVILSIMRRDDYFEKKKEEKRGKRDDKPYTKRESEKTGDGEEENQDPPKLGCVIYFKGAGNETSREDLKEVFGKHEPVEWVDFNRGDTQGYIRFLNPGVAQKAIDGVKADNDNKIIIKDAELEVKVVEGIEEKNYWILAKEERKRPRQKFQNRGRGRHRKDRGEGFRKRRRPWEDRKKSDKEEDKPMNEHKKFDDNGDIDNSVKTETKDSGETVEKKAKVETPVEKTVETPVATTVET